MVPNRGLPRPLIVVGIGALDIRAHYQDPRLKNDAKTSGAKFTKNNILDDLEMLAANYCRISKISKVPNGPADITQAQSMAAFFPVG